MPVVLFITSLRNLLLQTAELPGSDGHHDKPITLLISEVGRVAPRRQNNMITKQSIKLVLLVHHAVKPHNVEILVAISSASGGAVQAGDLILTIQRFDLRHFHAALTPAGIATVFTAFFANCRPGVQGQLSGRTVYVVAVLTMCGRRQIIYHRR